MNSIVLSKDIGEGTRIWDFVKILKGAKIGKDCNICDCVFIENDVKIGNRVTIKNGVQIWDGITISDDVFIGPNVTFVNDKYPESRSKHWILLKIKIESKVSIGANATILGGITLHCGARIGAGAVVTKDVMPGNTVMGNPASIRVPLV